MRRNLENQTFSFCQYTYKSKLSVTIHMLNNYALGRFHSLDLDQCIRTLGRLISSEPNQDYVDLKSPHLQCSS